MAFTTSLPESTIIDVPGYDKASVDVPAHRRRLCRRRSVFVDVSTPLNDVPTQDFDDYDVFAWRRLQHLFLMTSTSTCLLSMTSIDVSLFVYCRRLFALSPTTVDVSVTPNLIDPPYSVFIVAYLRML